MKQQVLIPSDISEAGKQYLRDRGYEIKMGHGLSEDCIIADARGCDAILVRNEPITRRILENIPSVKVLSKHGVGLDKIDLQAAAEQNLWVTNGPMSNAVAVAEHTVMLLLACAKKLVRFDLAIRSGDYNIRNTVKGIDVEGKTIGIIGCGKIGSMVAKKCIFGFGMRAVGYDPFLPSEARMPEMEYTDRLEEVFRVADFVSLHVPATEQNTGFVNQELLSLMKPTAYLINAARGSIINEPDLYEALKSEKIAGAGLDVYAQEPPSPENPLFTLPNITVTPHNASLTYETTDRMGLHAAQGIDEVLSGKTPTWPCVIPQNPR
ncbi:hydroxyacid dehydrogenase [Butyricicoccus faecihominis]|uniref:hydroxyacid dehydrogenase n=1 Tax=Butyricicoccaceae TaxID=3085642 RepID=UPI0024799115|nr:MULTISPECIES: hydroxyacid dehydrogenase [Butyricicoccaceae]MCQ5131358.1 hydroxyacid dehydrogenase [Butyricicoccus faecihominis]WNX83040.1 hydroxyacid dehydrogenase [Agathobaculum sp. NTUH-O15-33]